MARTQVTVSHPRHRRPADDLASTDLDPRPGAIRAERSWRCATVLRDATDFWSLR